jgi:pyruvate dehydrogenase E2 component (dihydrolipoamide acetyltransferase)
MAQSNGLDVASMSGTGPGGAVVMRDVEEQIAKGAALPLAATGNALINIKNLKRGSGDPVLFIHGFGADLTAWQKLLTTIGFPNSMLAFNLPGHGASGEVAKPGFASLVDAVATSLKAAGHTKLHLVGHSLGAAIAIALSARSGFEVLSLTLISPAGLGPTVDGSFVSGFLAAKSEAALTAQMQRLVHDSASLPAAVVRVTLESRKTGNVAASQAFIAEGIFEGSTQLFSVKAELARFQKPARVILGKRDAIIPSAETENAIPGHIAINRLGNVGHLPFVEAAALVERLIVEMVRSAG